MKQKKTHNWRPMLGKALVLMVLSCLVTTTHAQTGMKGDTKPLRTKAPKVLAPPPPPPKIKDPLDTTDSKGQPYFKHCDLPPTFKGGDKAMFAFIAAHLKLPQYAYSCAIEGTVYVGFIVETDGTLTDIKTKRGIGCGFNEEAEQLVQLMQGHWKPASYDGKPVRSAFYIPIKYRLE